MSNRPFERAVTEWLESGSDRTPPAAIDAVLLAIKTTPQERRGLLARWRFPATRTFARAMAVVVVAVVAIGWLALLAGRQGDVGGSGPSPSASPTPSVFQSPLYGYSIVVPSGWSATPATTRWDGESQPSLGPNVDQLAGPHLIVLGYAGPFSGDLTTFVQDRIAANARDHSDTCPSNALQLNEPTTIGGQAGVLLGLNCGARIDLAITVRDGVGYAFTIRDAAFSSTLDPTDFASVQSMLDSLISPVAPLESP